MAERVEEPIKYDTVPSYPGDLIGTGQRALPGDMVATRVPHESPLRTTPLPPQNWFQKHEALIIGTAAVVIFFAVWQAVGSARIVSRLFLPAPTDVIDAFTELVKDGELAQDLGYSGAEFGIGYVLAAVVAIPLALLIGWYPRFRYALDPFVTFLYATPRIVLLPLFIIWFGIGMESKVAVIFLGAFFAILINTTAGVRNLDAHLIKVARSLGAGDLLIFKTIALPGTVPVILNRLRLGIGHALHHGRGPWGRALMRYEHADVRVALPCDDRDRRAPRLADQPPHPRQPRIQRLAPPRLAAGSRGGRGEVGTRPGQVRDASHPGGRAARGSARSPGRRQHCDHVVPCGALGRDR